jgi:hypothetical protein
VEKLSDEQLGEFLRREGLHEETLEDWQAAVHAALAPASSRASARADKKRIEKLEKQLARKERALAAANAVVALQKKPRQANLWVSQSGSGRWPSAWYSAISACS